MAYTRGGGYVFLTRSGERELAASSYQILVLLKMTVIQNCLGIPTESVLSESAVRKVDCVQPLSCPIYAVMRNSHNNFTVNHSVENLK